MRIFLLFVVLILEKVLIDISTPHRTSFKCIDLNKKTFLPKFNSQCQFWAISTEQGFEIALHVFLLLLLLLYYRTFQINRNNYKSYSKYCVDVKPTFRFNKHYKKLIINNNKTS